MSKQAGLPKISSILQKVKISQKPIYTLFARRSSILIGVGLESATMAVYSAEEIFQWEGRGKQSLMAPEPSDLQFFSVMTCNSESVIL